MKVPDHPFARIALSCSGGGYRAASFHLGAMAYLHRLHFQGKPLLENVKALSTVSGGTITGVVYALEKKRGKSFEEIYSFLIKKLQKVDLVRLGLAKLSSGATWNNTTKRKNLINAFAEIYDQEFTGGETFDIFENMENTHLEEVMFNATEFNSGLIFRFQNDGHFGNYYNQIKRSIGHEVKLADVIAASSCFTGGFEPIQWPQDFIHDEAVELKDEAPIMATMGLMDGGIYDNQGIDSILRSEDRVDAPGYDLIIVSDVTSPYMQPFKFLENKKEKGWRNWTLGGVRSKILSMVGWTTGILVLGFILSVLFLIFNYGNNLISGILLSVSVVTLLSVLILFWLKHKIKRALKGGADYLRTELSDDLPLKDLQSLHFSEIPFHHLESLLMDRIKSLATLVGEVFLKTVRRLVYGRLYESDKHRYRRASNLIRELTRADFTNKQRQHARDVEYYQNLPGCDKLLVGDYDVVIGTKLENIAESAATFGTNLWFTETDKLDNRLQNLLISGQASMCFTLLKYLVELRCTPDNGYHELPVKVRSEIDLIWIQCLTDWKRFKVEPDFLTKSL